MSIHNLEAMLKRADPIDYEEGLVAYERYHLTMQKIADHYGFELERVVAVFVSLSPNSDYKGNLRSTVSVLKGVNEGVSADEIVVSTYGHCKRRAVAYATGIEEFTRVTKGPKIMNFYRNILDPTDNRFVTIDGHMSAIWQARTLTMKQALIKPSQYEVIKYDVMSLAFRRYLIPCQLQAILWFTRKRVDNVVYDPQYKLFADRNDVWNTFRDPASIEPYPLKGITQ